ncbi:Mg/Co/Ni transporter MgtE, CBS domain-containing [Candidatus Syntrophocurvum alkaliphilum]|uniref:Quaternary amine transport ATP-binding protein n=1 Tax=Candidatus Syntrophocurvum alkaliphilum TaxID=2293317 RepID=A0A6I6DCD8_9FIRM|nr:glycine betaine/L-proline ABC transporter ATP-binding protein [Candidatus Syntrophocurvum alkaliphilum]QGU00268.1 Mg/Co/Ni transporter MgtE, CBS domain-containing [Candidatus Syntrophocurvum alkaliphilum]
MEKIKVENLTKIYGPSPKSVLKQLNKGISKEKILKDRGHTIGVHNASFTIEEEETFVIMGLSGSGKSTLIRCLNLLNKPTTGSIYIDGEDITKYNKAKLKELRQNKMAMVFQNFGLFTHMTVMENVEYGLSVKKNPKEERQKVVLDVLKVVGLEGWEYHYPHELSGGMQQRVGLARALAQDPSILLMDEPFSALDPLIRRDMQLELIDLQTKLQKTIVFITHDINEAFKLGDRVAIMKDGIIEQIGTPEEILAEPASDYIKDFLQDIDRSKVLQAKNIMVKPSAMTFINSGPRVALQEMRANNISSIFVVNKNRELKGIVTVDDAIDAIKNNYTLEQILKHDYFTTEPEAYIQDLIPLATDTKYPIAVLDENNRFLGIIVRVSILSGLT